MRSQLPLAVIGFLVLIVCDEGLAVRLEVVQDVTLDQLQNSMNQNNNDFLKVGKCGGIKRAVLQFESPSDELPSACQIDSAMMKMYYLQGPVNPDSTLVVFRLMNDWSESVATYVDRTSTVPWSVPITNEAVAIPGSSYTFDSNTDQGFEDVSFDVTQAVKYWRDNPAQNSGVLVLADDDCVNFHSNHYTPESHHAYIDVTCKNIG